MYRCRELLLVSDNSVYADEMAVVDFDRDAPPTAFGSLSDIRQDTTWSLRTHLGYLRSDAGRFQLGDLNIEEGAGMVDRLRGGPRPYQRPIKDMARCFDGASPPRLCWLWIHH